MESWSWYCGMKIASTLQGGPSLLSSMRRDLKSFGNCSLAYSTLSTSTLWLIQHFIIDFLKACTPFLAFLNLGFFSVWLLTILSIFFIMDSYWEVIETGVKPLDMLHHFVVSYGLSPTSTSAASPWLMVILCAFYVNSCTAICISNIFSGSPQTQ